MASLVGKKAILKSEFSEIEVEIIDEIVSAKDNKVYKVYYKLLDQLGGIGAINIRKCDHSMRSLEINNKLITPYFIGE